MSKAAPPMSLKLGEELRERLSAVADRHKRTPHAVAAEAVAAYVAREEARHNFAADALAAWEHYQETGLHASGEDVLAWVESWGTPSELPVPPCRA